MNASFILAFLVTLAILILLFIWLSLSLQKNWSRHNRHGLSFLMPVFLSLLLLLLLSFEFRPRLLDIFSQQSENLRTYTLSEENAIFHPGWIEYNGRRFTLPMEYRDLDPKKTYRVTISRYSAYVFNLEEVKEAIPSEAGLDDLGYLLPSEKD